MAKWPDTQLRASLAPAFPVIDSSPCVIARKDWTQGSSHFLGNFSIPCDWKKQRQSRWSIPSRSGLARPNRLYHRDRPPPPRKKLHPIETSGIRNILLLQ